MSAPVADDVRMFTSDDTEAELLRERLRDPETLAALNRLLSNADLVAGLLEVVGGFFAHSDNIVENVATSYHEVVAKVSESPAGKRVVDAAPKLAKIADQSLPLIERVADTDLIERIGNSGLLDPALLDLVTRVADGVRAAQEQARAERGEKPAGLVRITRLADDPDVRRGTIFALRVVKELGRSLREDTTEGERG